MYEDDFAQSTEEYLANSGQFDEEGNRLVKNLDSNGRFHTDWLNMIYPRLKLAKDLLSDDGVIFISIDDNEQENMKKVCCEIFGQENFVAELIWERAYSPKNDAKYVSGSHDYVIMFARSIESFKIGRLPRTEEANARYRNIDNDPRGPWKPGDISVKTYNSATDYPITTPSGRVVTPPAGGCWRFNKETFESMVKDNRIYFGTDGSSVPSVKRFLSELRFEGMAPTSILFYKEVGHSQEGAKELSNLMDIAVFDGPKPVRFLERLLTLANLNDDSVVLDFFSGSASTAHAVMQYNFNNSKHIRFIMCQVQEKCEEGTKAHKANYLNICEIGKERIRRAGAKIKEENPLGTQGLDVGFRVLKCDTTNMKDVYYNPDAYEANLFESLTDNIKEDRTPEDLLFQVMLDLGVLLSSSIEETEIAGKKVFNVADGFLIACFDADVTEETITAIAKQQPYYFVMRDSSMASDSVAVNFEQIFATYSPDTVRKVL